MSVSNAAGNRASIRPIIERTLLVYKWAVYASFAFLAAGFAIVPFSDDRVGSELGNPTKLIAHVADLHPEGFFGIGIGLMILAPIVMLINAAVMFFRGGDARYGKITLVVAGVLSASILVAFLKG